jgi:tol-pal system protein YbgF
MYRSFSHEEFHMWHSHCVTVLWFLAYSEWRHVFMVRKVMGILLVLMALFSDNVSLAAPNQMNDTSRRLYDRVMDEFKQRDYEAALAGFRLFIEIHGQSALAANAQYWMGECQYRMGRYKDALNSFYNVIMTYPLSPKLAASTLKLGQTYEKLGDQENARIMFDRVVNQYPGTSESEVARKAIAVADSNNHANLGQSE